MIVVLANKAEAREMAKQDEKKTFKISPRLIIIPVLLIGSLWISRRSGVASSDLKRKLPGDDIVAHSNWTIDRSVVLNGSIDEVWPWIQQLGKRRAGWHAPSWMENILKSYAIRKIDTTYQQVKVGDYLDDWGTGVQHVVQVQCPHILLIECIRKINPKKGETKPIRPMDISILTMLKPIDSNHTKIIFRWRSHIAWYHYPVVRPLGGTFDYTTFKIMIAGLNERLAAEQLQKD
ncbi:hypothetical protein [Mucilaginibacter sp. OK098]|uniref:hypothetical protein n=1 Tax=Mucilaginibacter sp. OK098 TaxID=1855297 RepID=UPI001F3AA674|nr:hypothetical protein [Mucilaginibacter sp. OK098]